MKIKKIPWLPWLTFISAFLSLSFLLNFDYPAEHFFTLRLLLPSVDVWLLLLLMAVAACCGKRPLFWTTPPVGRSFLPCA